MPHLFHSMQSVEVFPSIAPMLCALDLALLLLFKMIPVPLLHTQANAMKNPNYRYIRPWTYVMHISSSHSHG